jgi:hypothetical protein
MNLSEIDDFTRHYLIAALWSSSDGEIESLLDEYSLDDLAPEAIAKAYNDCMKFQFAGVSLLGMAYEFYTESGMANHPDAGSPQACAGHDFWLTRAHYGVGFWDRGMGDLGRQLTELAQMFPEVDLYVGDDGKLYFS